MNGFQSVNVKGVVVGYSPSTQYDEEGAQKAKAEPIDKERDALIQLSAAAQQVNEYQQQQQQQEQEPEPEQQRSPSRELEGGTYAQAQQASNAPS